MIYDKIHMIYDKNSITNPLITVSMISITKTRPIGFASDTSPPELGPYRTLSGFAVRKTCTQKLHFSGSSLILSIKTRKLLHSSKSPDVRESLQSGKLEKGDFNTETEEILLCFLSASWRL